MLGQGGGTHCGAFQPEPFCVSVILLHHCSLEEEIKPKKISDLNTENMAFINSSTASIQLCFCVHMELKKQQVLF